MNSKYGDAMLGDGLMEFSLEELREFLEADMLDVRADPEFKEQLRRRLWELVQAKVGRSDG